MKKIILLSIILSTLAGCAQMQIDQQRNALLHQGQPPAYVDGYGDGYSSGTRAAGNPYFSFKKNIIRFNSNELYKQGWQDGYDHGKTSYSNIYNL